MMNILDEFDTEYEEEFNLISMQAQGLQNHKQEEYHFIIENNVLRINKKCSACCQLFSSSLMAKLYEGCNEQIKDVSEIVDLNLEKIDIQCLAMQLQKAERIIVNKLSLICYDIQMNQNKMEKVLNKHNISIPFSINQKIQSECQTFLENNKYFKEKYEKDQFLRNCIFNCCEYIHNLLQNVHLNKQLYYQYVQIIDDKTLSNEVKLNQLIKLKKETQNQKKLDFNNLKNNFPLLELGLLVTQYKTNKNRNKIIEQSFNLFNQYKNISNLTYLIFFKLYTSEGNLQPEQLIGGSIDSLVSLGMKMNYQYERLRAMKIKYLYEITSYREVIKLGEDILEHEDPSNLLIHQTLFQTYLILKDTNKSIKHLSQLYLDQSCSIITLLNKIHLYTTDTKIIVFSHIQKQIIQFILFQIVYTNLQVSSHLYMSGIQHWDLFMD